MWKPDAPGPKSSEDAALSLSPVADTPVGSFRRVVKNRSFLLLWLAQLLSQIVFNAANYGVIAIVTAISHSTLLVGFAIISFTLPAVPFSLIAGVYVDHLDKRLVLWVSNALRVLPWDMVDKSLSPPQTSFRLFFVRGQSGQATLSWKEAPVECCCRHLHPSPPDMTEPPRWLRGHSSGKRRQGVREHPACCPSAMGSAGGHGWCTLSIALS